MTDFIKDLEYEAEWTERPSGAIAIKTAIKEIKTLRDRIKELETRNKELTIRLADALVELIEEPKT